MLRKERPLGICWISLTSGKPCPGSPLLFWDWITKKANRSLDKEILLLCSLLALTSKMPLISLSMIFRPQIYLRVNISNPLHPLQSGTRWDSLVIRRKSRSWIQTFQRSVSLQNPLEPLWTRFPYQFLKNWNIKLGRTSPQSISRLPLLRLLRPATPLWKSVNIVWSLPSKKLKPRSRKVPILKKQSGVVTSQPVNINWVACLNGDNFPRRDAFTWGPFGFTGRSTGDILSHWTASFLGQKPFQLT